MIRRRYVFIITVFVVSAPLTACGGGVAVQTAERGGTGSNTHDGSDSDGIIGTDAVIDQIATAIKAPATADTIEQLSDAGKTIVVSGTDTTFNDLHAGESLAIKPTDSASGFVSV